MDILDYKIIFTGPMGAGKTTAITAISDIPPAKTEELNHDTHVHDKVSTTVALDYGQITLDDGNIVKLFGTPGQERFSFMWEILCDGAMGVILLLDASRPKAMDELLTFTKAFKGFAPDLPFVVGIGCHDGSDVESLDPFNEALSALGIIAPVYSVDVRKKDDVLILVDTLVCLLETATEK